MPGYGRVSSVFVDSDDNDVFVNVVTGPNREPRKMRFSTPYKGAWYVPMEGDIVEVHDIGGTKVAQAPANSPDFPIPADLGEGDFCFKFNDTTELRFSNQPDGTVDVAINSDGDVTVNAESITLGNEGGAESLAVQSHTHPYTWGDLSGSGNTGSPNEPGTQKTKGE